MLTSMTFLVYALLLSLLAPIVYAMPIHGFLIFYCLLQVLINSLVVPVLVNAEEFHSSDMPACDASGLL